MSDQPERVRFRQVVLLLVEGLGMGAQPDAAGDFDRGANTLSHTATYVGELELPFLQWLGLGNLQVANGVPPADPPAASVGTVRRHGAGRDVSGGTRELFDGALSRLVEAEVPVKLLGWIAEHAEAAEATVSEPELKGDKLVSRLVREAGRGGSGVVIASFSASSHGGGPVAIARGLAWFDSQIAAVLDAIDESTLLVISGIGGADPTFGARAVATREQSPLLAYTPAVPSGVNLGTRTSLADLGATFADNFDLPQAGLGESFFGPLLA